MSTKTGKSGKASLFVVSNDRLYALDLRFKYFSLALLICLFITCLDSIARRLCFSAYHLTLYLAIIVSLLSIFGLIFASIFFPGFSYAISKVIQPIFFLTFIFAPISGLTISSFFQPLPFTTFGFSTLSFSYYLKDIFFDSIIFSSFFIIITVLFSFVLAISTFSLI